MNDPHIISSDEGGPDYLNSRRWSNFDRLICWHHNWGDSDPLTTKKHRKSLLLDNQREPPTPDGECGVVWERPQKRAE